MFTEEKRSRFEDSNFLGRQFMASILELLSYSIAKHISQLLLLRKKRLNSCWEDWICYFQNHLVLIFEEQGVYIWEQFNFVREYFCLFDLAFYIRLLPIFCYALLKQIRRYNSCSRVFSVLETKGFTAKETTTNNTDKWWKENIIVSSPEVGRKLQGD